MSGDEETFTNTIHPEFYLSPDQQAANVTRQQILQLFNFGCTESNTVNRNLTNIKESRGETTITLTGYDQQQKATQTHQIDTTGQIITVTKIFYKNTESDNKNHVLSLTEYPNGSFDVSDYDPFIDKKRTLRSDSTDQTVDLGIFTRAINQASKVIGYSPPTSPEVS